MQYQSSFVANLFSRGGRSRYRDQSQQYKPTGQTSPLNVMFCGHRLIEYPFVDFNREKRHSCQLFIGLIYVTFSANLGFLWTDLLLPEQLRCCKGGFDAVECHWPFDVPPGDVTAALTEANIPMLGLNTRRGDVDAGDFGLAACPGRGDEARGYIDEAVAYAAKINAAAVHVMAGRTDQGKS